MTWFSVAVGAFGLAMALSFAAQAQQFPKDLFAALQGANQVSVPATSG